MSDAPQFAPRRKAPDPQAMKALLAGVATHSTELQLPVAPEVAAPAPEAAAPAVVPEAAPEAAPVAEVAPEPAVTPQAAPKARMTRSGKRLVQQNVRFPEDLAVAYRALCNAEDVAMQDDIVRMVKARVKAGPRAD